MHKNFSKYIALSMLAYAALFSSYCHAAVTGYIFLSAESLDQARQMRTDIYANGLRPERTLNDPTTIGRDFYDAFRSSEANPFFIEAERTPNDAPLVLNQYFSSPYGIVLRVELDSHFYPLLGSLENFVARLTNVNDPAGSVRSFIRMSMQMRPATGENTRYILGFDGARLPNARIVSSTIYNSNEGRDSVPVQGEVNIANDHYESTSDQPHVGGYLFPSITQNLSTRTDVQTVSEASSSDARDMLTSLFCRSHGSYSPNRLFFTEGGATYSCAHPKTENVADHTRHMQRELAMRATPSLVVMLLN